MPGETDPREERQARSLALEKAYVHDVYDQIAPHFTDNRYRAWPRVKQFLLDLEPASLVADVGCGNGKYLDANREVVMVGSDRCVALAEAARAKNHEVVACDNLQLPFRDETFDAALSVAVIHHFATTDRRVAALKELSRILRIGGKVLITVWAMEQRHRKFDSQDVLVPWHEPVKSSSEDRTSSIEREVTSTTTSDDDVLVYHAYSHISDSESQKQQDSACSTSSAARRRQKFRNAGRYRSAGSFERGPSKVPAPNSSRSSSELSSPNETCYSFVKRALQKLSSSASNSPFPSSSSSKKSNSRPYFYRSCRKPWASASMEFGPNLQAAEPESPRHELYNQSSIDSECQDHVHDEDVPIELRHLDNYEPCVNCGSPVLESTKMNHCQTNVCASCLPIDSSESDGKKSRSLGDFFNMIPKLLRVKKCEKEPPLSDFHKRISTASDPREYVVKSRGSPANGIVRSKSTLSFMSRLEEIMSLSIASDKSDVSQNDQRTDSNTKTKPPKLPSLTSSSLVSGDCPLILPESDRTTNPRRYNSPADALRKLRQDVSLDDSSLLSDEKTSNLKAGDADDASKSNGDHRPSSAATDVAKETESANDVCTENSSLETSDGATERTQHSRNAQAKDDENVSQEGHLSSYYSMPELYKLAEEPDTNESMFSAQRQRHISFYEQAQTVLRVCQSTEGPECPQTQGRENSSSDSHETSATVIPLRALVKRSLSVDTGDNTASSHQCPRRFSASAAQGVLASALRTYSLPRSSSRGSSVKSDTSVDSEESIVSVIPRKNNSITSDTSVDSEESVVSVIQRSTSEIETLVRESGLRNNISRLGSRSAQASPVTVLSSQTSSAESSPPQSGKNDGKFPGSGGVIDQLMQQQQQQQYHHQMSMHSVDGVHIRQDSSDHSQRTRRFLLRPISDPKMEDRFHSSSFDECIYRSSTTSRQGSGSNRSSLESDDQVIKEEDEKADSTITSPVDTASKFPSASSRNTGTSSTSEIHKQDAVTFSRTPSPIGPIKYIYDPLLTGYDPLDITSKMGDLSSSSCRTKITEGVGNPGQEDYCSATGASDTTGTDAEAQPTVDLHQDSVKNQTIPDANGNSNEGKQNEDPASPEVSSATCSSNVGEVSESPIVQTSSEASRYERLRKLSQRLENLGLSSELLRSFYTSTEDEEAADDTECNQDEGGETKSEEEDNRLQEEQSSQSEELKQESCNTDGTTAEKSDEDSFVDESLRTVIHDLKTTDDHSTPKERDTENAECVKEKAKGPPSRSGSTSHSDETNAESECESRSPVVCKEASNDSKNASASGEQKPVGGVRNNLKKKLKRSCVTIDEVECREVASSEDTSPSSSTSLEWNDFDKVDSSADYDSSALGATASCRGATGGGPTNVQVREEGVSTPPVDVNVAEPETKFNVFLDKEICLFFETPSSSSMGKSASSSSNATDFSTTSDRIRGVMQREKSDDRSSKESDSDNLSKLSDFEARSDSAFSEDFARKTDLASSSSSASLDVFDAHRSAKMGSDSSQQSWGDYDGCSSSSKERQAWILDNIDEIPDDEKHYDIEALRNERSKKFRREPSDDSSTDSFQRRENFLGSGDFYRRSYEDSLPSQKEESQKDEDRTAKRAPEFSQEEPEASRNICRQPVELCAQSSSPKDSDANEAPTDILAAFVETISDLTSVFGELYPRHEAKFEDVSSDDSLEISSFERVLTSQEPRPAAAETETLKPEKEKKKSVGPLDFWFGSKTSAASSGSGAQSCSGDRPDNLSPDPSSDSDKPKSASPKRPIACQNGPLNYDSRLPANKVPTAHQKKRAEPALRKQDSDDSSGVSDVQKPSVPDSKPSKPSKKAVEDLKLKCTPKPKPLNRSSQSVCAERPRQDSTDADDDSTSRTHSAPCSPRLKPQQRSVDDVISSSKAELSRQSSLSTSQESLPGNQSGDTMAYHRYYHVFRQGELDSLIENYVDNLHILASYYDHANWCVLAEKVQVWTI